MWRDYESENGGAMETMPGWRRLAIGSGKVNGIFGYRGVNGTEHLALHINKSLYSIPVNELVKLTEPFTVAKLDRSYLKTNTLLNAPSVFFESGGKCYLLDGNGYYSIGVAYTSGNFASVRESAYVPVTYFNGELYEQRNMMTADFIERYTVDISHNRVPSYESVWEYKLIEKDGTPGLSLSGVSSFYDATDLICAYVPRFGIYNGVEYPILSFESGFFGKLDSTVQLVVDAPLYLYGTATGGDGAVSGMTSLQRLILRNKDAKYDFDACNLLVDRGGHMEAVPNAPLRELWIAGATFSGFGDPADQEGCSDGSVGITSAYDGTVNLYTECSNEMWGGVTVSKTNVINGVIFAVETVGGELVLSDTTRAEVKSDGGATVEVSAIQEKCTVTFDPLIAYSHVHLQTDLHTYCILTRNRDTGATCEENGRWYEYVIYEPFKSVKSVILGNFPTSKYKCVADGGKVAVFIPPHFDGQSMDIKCEGYPNKFASVNGLTTVYDNGYDSNAASWEAINKCTVVCAYDGRVFFTGNPNLPNTVFFSGRGLSGENDPTYIGIYNYFNDGIGNVPNTAMVSSASMLAVLKGDISTDSCAYYHAAQYNGDEKTADLLPRIYPSTEGVSNVPCVGAACNFADDIVFLSPKGLEGIEKQSLNLERTLSHRSGRVDPVLRKSLSSSSRMVEWKGYLCILNSDGVMLLADSRAINSNEATGEAQYEWFMLEEVGSYSEDHAKWVFVNGSINVNCADGTTALLPLESLTVKYGGEDRRVCIGAGDPPDTAEVISFGTVFDGAGIEYEVAEGGMNAVLTDGVFCPVVEDEERVGGTFRPATALFEFRGRLFFGTENGELCVFNTDKRGMAYDVGEAPDVIGSKWYDRCGHRYESGFATLSDDCGYPQFAKSTVGKTLTLRAKRMPRSAFTLSVRSEREDWRTVESFTATDNSFFNVDFANFSFEDNSRSSYASSEKLKRWGEKQMYFYSDGFRQPFGIYGISYCYTFAGKRR